MSGYVRRAFANIALLLAVSGAAAAQDMLNNTPDYIGAWNHAHIMRHPGDSARTSRESQSQREARDRAAVVHQLAYRSSPRVTARVHTAFADYLGGAGSDRAGWPALLRAVAQDNPPGSPFAEVLGRRFGDNRSKIFATLQSGAAQAELRKGLAAAGRSDKNLLDVHASFLMISWIIANGEEAVRNPNAAFEGIQAQLVAQRADDAGGDDATLQEAAETMALLDVMFNVAWFGATPAEQQILQRGVAALGRRLGMDYTRLGLTASGFRSL